MRVRGFLAGQRRRLGCSGPARARFVGLLCRGKRGERAAERSAQHLWQQGIAPIIPTTGPALRPIAPAKSKKSFPAAQSTTETYSQATAVGFPHARPNGGQAAGQKDASRIPPDSLSRGPSCGAGLRGKAVGRTTRISRGRQTSAGNAACQVEKAPDARSDKCFRCASDVRLLREGLEGGKRCETSRGDGY